MDTIHLHKISDLFKLFQLQQNAKLPLVGEKGVDFFSNVSTLAEVGVK